MLREATRLLSKSVGRSAMACALLFIATSASGGSDAPIPTNLSLLKSMTEEALTEILDSLDLPSGKPIYVEAAAHHETNWLVAESLASLLRKRGMSPILLEEGSTGGAAPQQPAGAAPAGEEKPSESGGDDDSPPGVTGEENEDHFAGEENDEFGNDQADQEENLDDEVGSEEDDFGNDEDDEFGEERGEDEDEPSPGQSFRPDPSLLPERPQLPPATTTPSPPSATPRRKIEVEGDVLRFRVVELGVVYPKSKRALLLLGPKSITRFTGAHLRVTHVTEPDGTVQGVANSEHHLIDRFPGSVRAYVEGADYPFTRPEIQPAPWGKLVEPAAVLGIVSGLVYLFYANQN